MNNGYFGTGFMLGVFLGVVVTIAVMRFGGAPTTSRYGQACALIYAPATTAADSLRLARESGCPFKVEP